MNRYAQMVRALNERFFGEVVEPLRAAVIAADTVIGQLYPELADYIAGELMADWADASLHGFISGGASDGAEVGIDLVSVDGRIEALASVGDYGRYTSHQLHGMVERVCLGSLEGLRVLPGGGFEARIKFDRLDGELEEVTVVGEQYHPQTARELVEELARCMAAFP